MPIPESEFSLKNGFLQFKEPFKRPVSARVQGPVINAVPNGKEKLEKWKVKVARTIKGVRHGAPWSPHERYAVTLKFRFHLPTHRNQRLDVENFVKPVVDAVAAGLFCPEQTDPGGDWNYDDSNFRTLLIHRGPDAPSRVQEGVRVFVSVRQP